MIPKTIHYCWFGHGPLPELAQKCIASWRKYLPDYEIKEWNENNFDVNILPYTADAYAAKKYAFVSDYARFWVLYHYGGVYFDTDVEVIRSMDDVLEKGPFMGLEVIDPKPLVAPGLGLAAVQGMELYEAILSKFELMTFGAPDGTINPYTMIPMVTERLLSRGLRGDGAIEHIDGVDVYPPEWFNPFDDATGQLVKTSNTHTIHWYAKSWMKAESAWKVAIKRAIRRVVGKDAVSRVKKLLYQ